MMRFARSSVAVGLALALAIGLALTPAAVHSEIIDIQAVRSTADRSQTAPIVQTQASPAQAQPAQATPANPRKKAPDSPAQASPAKTKPAEPKPAEPPVSPAAPPPTAATLAEPPAEAIEIDVSTRNVAITSTFSGTEIVVFGSVDNSRQQIAGSGFYDIVVVVDGASTPAIVREKKRVYGIWVNADRMRFDSLPLYRAVASSRPLEEIADPAVLATNRITLDHYMRTPGTITRRATFGAAATRLKQRDGLYVSKDYGAAFLGRSLFRAGVKLPANIPVGPLEVRVLLIKDGEVLASRVATVRLVREGLERLIYDFAYEQPFWYGILAVAIALGAGLIGSAVFQRQSA
ncbi:MAG: TIGR02186 family protein [Hyphomicrobium aestuarii]|nr:TIGR02186 family protein [Hyphomicrobium aestuarii]